MGILTFEEGIALNPVGIPIIDRFADVVRLIDIGSHPRTEEAEDRKDGGNFEKSFESTEKHERDYTLRRQKGNHIESVV